MQAKTMRIMTTMIMRSITRTMTTKRMAVMMRDVSQNRLASSQYCP